MLSMKYNFILISFLILSSCTPIVIGTTAATVAVTSMQERTVGTIIDDKTVWARIKKSLLNAGLSKGVNVSVNEGRVLLTGNVNNSMERVRVVRKVWEQQGVREVMSELNVENKEDSFTKSAWITAQIKLSLLMKASIKSFNYTVETYDGTVYLIGVAQNKDELKKVYNIARKTPGVNQVVSYVRPKNSNLRFR
jgi:osmotically-inducible protein OsmY